jgi:nucleoside-diphosphate-sugar epimerase
MEMRGKVALVTGANGFVGSFVARRLREAGPGERGAPT